MKRFRLLKDLPFAKAGAIFEVKTEIQDGVAQVVFTSERYKNTKIWTNSIGPDDCDEWFEEIKELKKYYYIGSMGHIESAECKGWELSLKLRKSIGNYFETEEEAEKYLKYLKAKAIIKQDTRGFKPNWKNCENKYYGYWDSGKVSLDYLVSYITKYSDICFKTEEDIKESFEKHPNEWRTYLTYEQ